MNNEFKINLLEFMLDCKNHHELAKFYSKLLNWQIIFDTEEYSGICAPGAVQGINPCITFQKNSDYKQPIWPDEPDKQQQMAHIDFAVDDLSNAVQHAMSCGATIAKKQYSDQWTVMIDPEGHPFCLCLNKVAASVNLNKD